MRPVRMVLDVLRRPAFWPYQRQAVTERDGPDAYDAINAEYPRDGSGGH